jgi:hypothetical protein
MNTIIQRRASESVLSRNIKVIKYRRMRWAGQVARMGVVRNFLFVKLERKKKMGHLSIDRIILKSI